MSYRARALVALAVPLFGVAAAGGGAASTRLLAAAEPVSRGVQNEVAHSVARTHAAAARPPHPRP